MINTRLRREDQIQFFRFIAFVMIFLWHAKTWRIKYLPGDVGAQTGVYFFFLLTGVMASYSLALKEVSPTKENIKDYLKRKLVRLYPLYFVTNLLTFLYNGGQGFVVSRSKNLCLLWLEILFYPLLCYKPGYLDEAFRSLL